MLTVPYSAQLTVLTYIRPLWEACLLQHAIAPCGSQGTSPRGNILALYSVETRLLALPLPLQSKLPRPSDRPPSDRPSSLSMDPEHADSEAVRSAELKGALELSSRALDLRRRLGIPSISSSVSSSPSPFLPTALSSPSPPLWSLSEPCWKSNSQMMTFPSSPPVAIRVPRRLNSIVHTGPCFEHKSSSGKLTVNAFLG